MKRLLLAITGSIAAYKVPDIIRQLKREGFILDIVASKESLNYVTVETLNVLNQGHVYTDNDVKRQIINHITLSKRNDLLIVLPATANSIAKFATGICDNLISMLFLEFSGQKIIFPCMHTQMYQNRITQKNIEILKEEKTLIINPDTGDLACGDHGLGRLPQSETIIEVIKKQSHLPLKNKKIIITCGGTSEDIDNVRIISNKSTGKQGLSLTKKAIELGAEVTLITSVPTTLPVQKKIIITSHKDLANAINNEIKNHTHIFMAAAVSDFTCKKSITKLKRKNQNLTLIQTEDILKSIKKKVPKMKIIGFCLTDKDLETETQKKLKEKNCDIMIGNHPDVFGKDKRSVIIIKKNNSKRTHLKNIDIDEISIEILKEGMNIN